MNKRWRENKIFHSHSLGYLQKEDSLGNNTNMGPISQVAIIKVNMTNWQGFNLEGYFVPSWVILNNSSDNIFMLSISAKATSLRCIRF